MKTVFLALGSNIEDRINFIQKAIKELSEYINVLKISTVYESMPWGVEEQPAFLNCVLKSETSLSPEDLLSLIKEIEAKVGRKERFRWGPREIDIDILLYEDEVIDTPSLKIPHPFLCERDFFLYPILEIEPDLKLPPSGTELLKYTSSTENKLIPFCCITYRPLHTFPSFPH